MGRLLAVLLFAFPAIAQVPLAASRYRLELTRIVHAEWGLGGPVATMAAQLHQESAWNPLAVSPVGARGMSQFMPSTANWIGDLDSRLKGGDLYSPTWAMRAQSVYMKHLHGRLAAVDGCERMAFALSAYNGGEGWVRKRKAVSPAPGRCIGLTCEINPGIHPANQRENAEYPKRILLRIEPLYETWGVGSCP